MRITPSLRAGICPSAGLGVDDEQLPMSLIAAYDSGAGISVQPRNVFNPPPVCRWVQPAGQGLVLLVGIKQHVGLLVNNMLLFFVGVVFGTMTVRRRKSAQWRYRTRILPSIWLIKSEFNWGKG